MNVDPSTLTFALLFGGACVGGLLFLLFVVPLLAQIIFGFEIYNMIVDAIGEYTGRPRLVQIGCLALVLLLVSCCCATAAVSAGIVTCFTPNPVQLCRLIGR
jgi:hypothetical protein